LYERLTEVTDALFTSAVDSVSICASSMPESSRLA